MEKILGISKLTTKGQITIPKVVREKLNLKTGNIVVFIERNGEIIIRRSELKY
ncbi:MAG: type II toxin-antitoxin system PrlF family antitoxin [Candidatus Odinarchaeota archaeon]|nr:type II toxin-antitoxin system PrlF family antitoxin [Candidatus Odinarchaeota archaeon]